MKAAKLIKILTELKEKHGDCEVAYRPDRFGGEPILMVEYRLSYHMQDTGKRREVFLIEGTYL